MTIEILPAQLANQIAAGEVVERPASVIKELVENSIDAGATQILIDVEKGGTKKLRISDNGSGIIKEELTLALSRHATSKIKNLADLEGIDSLGFRGEALASISSVSRLTLTSKPIEQESAWQASAAGRDMDVIVQPAAHPNGTTIEVKDLFFNTPARRKFLRTDKTEFTHIDEVVKRIALARFDVGLTLTHNGKIIRQYRACKDKAQQAKRVAMVCGKKFVEEAIEVDCHHDNLHLWGWIAKPSFSRSQNDLCYSYVNGRMMRDKLINHAIRQSYANKIANDQYPAFVLFLTLDFREVDVNVHPAKHEVRFHQSRYIHDFIFSVCNNALNQDDLLLDNNNLDGNETVDDSQQVDNLSYSNAQSGLTKSSVGTSRFEHQAESVIRNEQPQIDKNYQQVYQQREVYVSELKPESVHSGYEKTNQNNGQTVGTSYHYAQPSNKAKASYQALMTTQDHDLASQPEAVEDIPSLDNAILIQFVAPVYAVIKINHELRLLSLLKLSQKLHYADLLKRRSEKMISQPLLLPVMIECDKNQIAFIDKYHEEFEHMGIICTLVGKKVKIREFPAKLRDKNISASFNTILSHLSQVNELRSVIKDDFYQSFSVVLSDEIFSAERAELLLQKAKNVYKDEIVMQLGLNSVVLDLTSSIRLLNSLDE